MKFNITRQQVLPSLVTLFFTCLIGMFSLIARDYMGVGLEATESMLGGYITDFQLSHRVWSAIITAITIFLMAINLGGIVSRNNLYATTTHIQIPLLGMLLWGVCLNEEFLLSVLLAALCAQIVGGLLLSVRNGLVLGPLFNASMLLSLLPLFYPSAAVMWIIIPISLILMNVTSREWLVAFFGLLLPVASVSYLHWLAGEDFLFISRMLLNSILAPSALFETHTIHLFRFLLTGIGVLLALFSIIWAGGDIHKNRVRLQIIIVMFFATLASILSPSATLLTLPLMMPICAILVALSLVNFKSWIANFIYFLILALLLMALLFPQTIYLPLNLEGAEVTY